MTNSIDYQADVIGKLKLNSDGYLDFFVKELRMISDVPNYTEIKRLDSDKKYLIEYDSDNHKYIAIDDNNNITDLDLTVDYVIKYWLICMIDEHRNDCRYRDRLAYESMHPDVHQRVYHQYLRNIG